MNGFYSLRRSFRMFGGRFARLGVLVALVIAWCMLPAQSQATPITLAFDAIVGPPRQGTNALLPPEWGVTLVQGDTISGEFTFDPLDAPSNVHQTSVVEQFRLTVQIKTRTLTTSQYSIDVDDNSNPIDSNGPFDSIIIKCSLPGGGTVCAPSVVQSTEPLQLAAVIALYAGPSVLDGADIPADVDTWQQFTSDNTMLVSLNDQVNFRFYGFLATIQSFRGVPEPSTRLELILGAVLLFIIRRTLKSYFRVSSSGDHHVLSSPP